MLDFNEIKKYLPTYLSQGSSNELFSELKDFPNNIDQRMYTDYLKDNSVIYQGDGIKELPVVEVNENNEVNLKKVDSILLSNTCDISPENIRIFPFNISYCPIVSLQKYKELLIKKLDAKKLEEHIKTIKEQRYTQIFYLPKGGNLEQEYIVFFDKLYNCNQKFIKIENLQNIKLFTLSNFGFYLFLFKISIHFTRIREGEDRKYNFTQP